LSFVPLFLSFFCYDEQIPEEWASLSALTSIDLSRNKLSGWLPALLFEEWGRGTRLKQGGGSGAAAAGSGRARPVGGTAGVGAGRKGGDRDEDRFGRREDEEEGVIVGQGLRSLSLHHNHFNGALPDTLRVLKVCVSLESVLRSPLEQTPPNLLKYSTFSSSL